MKLRSSSLSLTMALIAPQLECQHPYAFTDTLRIATPRRRAVAQNVLCAMPTKHNSDSRSEFSQRRKIGGVGQRGGSPTPSTATSSPSLSPTSALGMIVDSQRDFDINLGRAVDTLRIDYPGLLTKNPDWKIYHDDLEVIDPSGVSLHGLNNYKRAFFFIHGVVKMFYCDKRSGLTSIRLGYDWARKCIRVSWNVELVPKMIYGGIKNTLHVDGISEYYLDRESGLITEHKVSHLLINDQTVRPVNGIFNALAEISPVNEPGSVPVFMKHDQQQLWDVIRRTDDVNNNHMWSQVKFQLGNPVADLIRDPSTTSLFSKSSEQTMSIPNNDNSNSIAADSLPYDIDALQRKNRSRQKFGMPPLTPEEFLKIEEEVRAMDALNKKKAAFLAEQLAQKKKEKSDFLSNIFGGVLKNGCESNFDCERPQVCCDVGFKKICCSNGLGIVDGIPVEKYERGLLRVPVPNDNIDYY